jgi:hypothetical protein
MPHGALANPFTAVARDILKDKYFQFLKPKCEILGKRLAINHMTDV